MQGGSFGPAKQAHRTRRETRVSPLLNWNGRIAGRISNHTETRGKRAAYYS